MKQTEGRRERKRQQTMNHLADTAWEMFETKGYDNVTMEAIAEAADVAKGTLYKHFPVKEALLRHRFHRELAAGIPDILAELAALPTIAGRLRKFLSRGADWSIQHRQHLRHYLAFRISEMGVPYDVDSPHRSGMDRIFFSFIVNGQESGEFRSDIDATTAAHYLEFLYLAALLRWLSAVEADLHAEFNTMLDLFLKGVAS